MLSSLQLPSHKDLIQKILPADFSSKEDTKQEDFNEGEKYFECVDFLFVIS